MKDSQIRGIMSDDMVAPAVMGRLAGHVEGSSRRSPFSLALFIVFDNINAT